MPRIPRKNKGWRGKHHAIGVIRAISGQRWELRRAEVTRMGMVMNHSGVVSAALVLAGALIPRMAMPHRDAL